MLGLAGLATKRLKALRKQLWAIVWQAVANKPIWGFFAATVISLPCTAEAPALDGAKKVAPELVSNSKVLGEDLDQSPVKLMATKPNENGRVDSNAKGDSRRSQTRTSLTPERKAMNGDVAKQGNDSAYECDDYCCFYGWIPLI